MRGELFSLEDDPLEMRSLAAATESARAEHLMVQLRSFLEKANSHQPRNWVRAKADLDNELVRQRLRDLGYIE